MGIQQKLHTKLVQKLILTPSLQQAIKLLPMSTLELSDLLNQEMVENPMLEEVPTEELQPAEAAAAAEKTEAEPAGEQDRHLGRPGLRVFLRRLSGRRLPSAGAAGNQGAAADREHAVDGQLAVRSPDVAAVDADRRSADAGDRLGHHRQPGRRRVSGGVVRRAGGHGPVAGGRRSSGRCGWSRASIRPASRRATCRSACCCSFGISGLEGTPTEKIVTDHLRLLQNHQVPEIARKLGLTIDDLKEHIEVIRHLDPKPGSRYNPTQSQYVIPDVYVIKVEDQYVAVLNEDGLPQMRISPVYRRLLDKGAADNSDETRAYVKDKFRSALWLIKSVEQRQKTIHKVANSIINFQRDFLDHGIEHLRPLVLRDVANDIGMHESTVSRVVTNKYMHTPQGVFEMKYFFHSGISSSYGESVSSVTIKQRIRKIIENEDPRKPLSDSKIVSILQREGLVLARRTIAKYREELKIPTSNQRKVLY